jgi:cysteine-rich repeat protein
LVGVPTVTIAAGKLEVDVADANAIDADGANSGTIEVTIYRACSGDGTTRCLDDTDCAAGSLGTCSAGNTGTITYDGKISGAGFEPADASVRAAGDITLLRAASFSAQMAGVSGPNVTIESGMGSLTVDIVTARSGMGSLYYELGYGGYIELRAPLDIVITGNIDAWGAQNGGIIDIEAGRDIFLRSKILNDAGLGLYASGGGVTLTAGRDVVVGPGASGDSMQEIDTDGGGGAYRYGYGYGSVNASGYGGYQDLFAGQNISLAQSSNLHSRGGPGALGGNITISSDGMTTINGQVRAIGPPPAYSADAASKGGFIQLVSREGVTFGSTGILDATGVSTGGYVYIEADGPVTLDGLIDVRGTIPAGTAPGGYERLPEGGWFSLDGMADVSFGGRIRAGAGWRGGRIGFDVCRLELTESGIIDHSFGQPNPDNGYNEITIRESMTMAPGSKLLADSAGGRNLITYRDQFKPPVLDGTIKPAPLLDTNPSLSGCPVCGNFEIDQGESCDDGNTTSGDGCRADCQDEGCLAQSPGFPSTPMCDDGSGCTLDRCNATAHTCTHVLSCEEGVQCTVDACASGSCQHTPDDSLCDDGEECTDDLCNPTSGCVHANLTGPACEDGDFCTVTGSCDAGHCSATDLSLAENDKVSLKFTAGPDNDRMTAKLNLPLSQLTANPTLTGMKVVMTDTTGAHVYEADIPAANWEDRNGTGQSFRFRDSHGTVGPANGVNSASIKRNEAKGLAKALVKMGGAEIPDAAGQQFLSVSLLFGSDPNADDCITARLLPCKLTATSSKCSD